MSVFLTAAQMRAAEQAAITSGAVSGATLMARAGQAVVREICARRSEPGRAVVLCGPGNNGGDGFVIARGLKAAGWAVWVGLLGRPDALPPDAAQAADLWRAEGGITALPGDVAAQVAQADLVVDALFGTGLTRPFAGVPGLPELPPGAYVVAVDLPSGLCADSGRVLGGAAPIAADLTVTFHCRKRGHGLGQGPQLCGETVCADIGLPAPQGADLLRAVSPPEGLDKTEGHKFDHGHAVVLSGPAGRTGAARLAARGALRVGAGLVTLGAPRDAAPEIAAQITAIMLREVGQGADLTALLRDARISALCLGPGMGLDRADLLDAALEAPCPLLLDADALTLLNGAPERLRARMADTVLTPHEGEFARLFPDLAAQLRAPAERGPAFGAVEAAQRAAARAGAVLLLKGPSTVIAAPDGRVALLRARAPWLATAGSGDVLAGLITGLLARGQGGFAAAQAGAWLHGAAARRFGPGLIAEDLPDQLPALLRSLLG